MLNEGRIRRVVVALAAVVLAATSLYFWLVPPADRGTVITWTGLLVTGSCALVLTLLFHRVTRTWRGFGVILALHVVSQAWLQWQWGMWDSPVTLIRNLNVVAGLVIVATLVALFVCIVLLLIFQDASAIALAVAWIGYPLLLVGTALHYHSFDRLNDLPLRDSIILVVPNCLLPFLVVFGGLAFFAHYFWLVGKEITGREI